MQTFQFSKRFFGHAVLDLLESIHRALDDTKIAREIFKDFEKAFDTLSHDNLLQKLDHHGIIGTSNDLVQILFD